MYGHYYSFILLHVQYLNKGIFGTHYNVFGLWNMRMTESYRKGYQEWCYGLWGTRIKEARNNEVWSYTPLYNPRPSTLWSTPPLYTQVCRYGWGSQQDMTN